MALPYFLITSLALLIGNLRAEASTTTVSTPKLPPRMESDSVEVLPTGRPEQCLDGSERSISSVRWFTIEHEVNLKEYDAYANYSASLDDTGRYRAVVSHQGKNYSVIRLERTRGTPCFTKPLEVELVVGDHITKGWEYAPVTGDAYRCYGGRFSEVEVSIPPMDTLDYYVDAFVCSTHPNDRFKMHHVQKSYDRVLFQVKKTNGDCFAVAPHINYKIERILHKTKLAVEPSRNCHRSDPSGLYQWVVVRHKQNRVDFNVFAYVTTLTLDEHFRVVQYVKGKKTISFLVKKEKTTRNCFSERPTLYYCIYEDIDECSFV